MPMWEPKPGELVRYDQGSTALALIGNPHAGGWHGQQCMGGYCFFTRYWKPTLVDRVQWVESAMRYRRKTEAEARAEAGLPVLTLDQAEALCPVLNRPLHGGYPDAAAKPAQPAASPAPHAEFAGCEWVPARGFAINGSCSRGCRNNAHGCRSRRDYMLAQSATSKPPVLSPVVQGVERRKPIDMVLFCPACGAQHIDKPMTDAEYAAHLHESSWWELGGDKPKRWTNPPHKSHQCQNAACGHVWRPADVPTNGVAAVQTKGKADSTPFGASAHPARVADTRHIGAPGPGEYASGWKG